MDSALSVSRVGSNAQFKYLKRLFRKYRMTGDIKVRLVVNHIIILTNVFTIE